MNSAHKFCMKRNCSKTNGETRLTLGDLVATVDELTDNKRLNAAIVADLINRRRVRLEGCFHGKRVTVG